MRIVFSLSFLYIWPGSIMAKESFDESWWNWQWNKIWATNNLANACWVISNKLVNTDTLRLDSHTHTLLNFRIWIFITFLIGWCYYILPKCSFFEELLTMIPERLETRQIKDLLETLEDCMVTSKFLRNNHPEIVNLNTFRVAFDEVMEKYPSMSSHLSPRAPIATCPDPVHCADWLTHLHRSNLEHTEVHCKESGNSH